MLHLVHAYFQVLCLSFLPHIFCVLAFFLTMLKLQKHFPDKQLKSFYISEEKTFPELDLFLKSSVAAYNLNNSVFPGERF